MLKVRPLVLLEVLAYWLETPKPDRGGWLPFAGLVGLAVAFEVLVALWIMGAFRTL